MIMTIDIYKACSGIFFELIFALNLRFPKVYLCKPASAKNLECFENPFFL